MIVVNVGQVAEGTTGFLAGNGQRERAQEGHDDEGQFRTAIAPCHLINSFVAIFDSILFRISTSTRYGTNPRTGVKMQPAPIKPTITLDDLSKIDIRLGTIESA